MVSLAGLAILTAKDLCELENVKLLKLLSESSKIMVGTEIASIQAEADYSV